MSKTQKVFFFVQKSMLIYSLYLFQIILNITWNDFYCILMIYQ